MDKIFPTLLLALALLIGGCFSSSSDYTVPVSPGTPFELKIGDKASLSSDGIVLTFLNVTEDSRCPSDVVCVWEGQVSVLMDMKKNGNDLGNFILTKRSGQNELSEKSFEGFTVRLLSVELPYEKNSNSKIEPQDYLAKFEISRS